MATIFRKYWHTLARKAADEPQSVNTAPVEQSQPQARTQEVDISPDDPLMAYLLNATGVVEIGKLELDSPALSALREAGVRVSVPLISQGELIGLLNLGPRLSEQEYSTYDHRLLNNLATQAAPALRVAQMARQQQVEARRRERLDHELRVARVIQQTLLPKEIPLLPGWQLAAHWQPARAVSGDFYDFIAFPDGKLGLIEGDVTDKGVPAALVMATTRSILRGAAELLVSPAAVLQRANELLCPDIPTNMFVTCLYAVLDPASGRLCFANAGHNLPYKRTENGVVELRATGMPLGLMPEMTYEEKEDFLAPGESVLIYSDGLVEAHNQQGEMFGFPKLRELMAEHPGGSAMIEFLRHELVAFTGLDWEQEDDVTYLTIQREVSTPVLLFNERKGGMESEQWTTLAEFTLPSETGNERQAMELVADTVQSLNLPKTKFERLKTAVAEAALNAMEHGNHFRPDLKVAIKVLASSQSLAVHITDQGGNQPIPDHTAPDLEAKLAGLESPRGWGLFLIKNMVDEMHITSDKTHHTVELILNLKGDENGDATV